MAVEEEVAGLSEKLGVFARSKLASIYDEKRDVLFIFRLDADKRKPAISFDVGGEGWVRQEPSSGLVDSIEIEDFERTFLKKHRQLHQHWIKAKKYVGGDNAPNRELMPTIIGVLEKALK